jgi:hypothetical protein
VILMSPAAPHLSDDSNSVSTTKYSKAVVCVDQAVVQKPIFLAPTTYTRDSTQDWSCLPRAGRYCRVNARRTDDDEHALFERNDKLLLH